MIHRPPDRDKLGDFSPVACQCDGFSLQYSLDGCPEVFAQITSSHQSAFRKSEEYFIRVKRILPNIVRSSWNIVHIVEIVQISDINTFVNKDFFNQAAFMNLVSDELSKRDIPQVRLTEALGKAESAFQRWMHPKKPKRLDVNEIIAICHFFEWRPSWALFGEGPQSDAEAHEIALIRDVIALLGDDARRAVGNAQYVPEPQLVYGRNGRHGPNLDRLWRQREPDAKGEGSARLPRPDSHAVRISAGLPAPHRTSAQGTTIVAAGTRLA